MIPFYPIGLNASKGYNADDNNLNENLVLNFTPNAHDISTPNGTLDITSDVYNISIHTMHNFLATPISTQTIFIFISFVVLCCKFLGLAMVLAFCCHHVQFLF